MGGVASVPTDPTRQLQVIGAGLPRTGTVSMAMALEKLLGGPAMHGGTQLVGREDAYTHLWARIFDAKFSGDRELTLKLLREATAGFVAITDAPGVCFIKELQELYPDAVVIAVSRDKNRWFRSFEMIGRLSTHPWLPYFLAPVPGWRWAPRVLNGVERVREWLGETSPDTLGQFNKWVRDHTPPDKFFKVKLKDGWAPLCRILNKPIPDEPFPRANDAEAVARLSRIIFVRTLMVWCGACVGAGLLGILVGVCS